MNEVIQDAKRKAWTGHTTPVHEDDSTRELRQSLGHPQPVIRRSGVDASKIESLVGSLQAMINEHRQQGNDIRPYIRENDIVPRELAAKLKPNDNVFRPIEDHERFAAMVSAEIERYASRGPKNSPGQMGLFGDGLGGEMPLRKADSQTRWVTINGSHVLIDSRGKVIAGAGGKLNGRTVKSKREGRKYFRASGKELSSWAESGDENAQQEIDRRKTRRIRRWQLAARETGKKSEPSTFERAKSNWNSGQQAETRPPKPNSIGGPQNATATAKRIKRTRRTVLKKRSYPMMKPKKVTNLD